MDDTQRRWLEARRLIRANEKALSDQAKLTWLERLYLFVGGL